MAAERLAEKVVMRLADQLSGPPHGSAGKSGTVSSGMAGFPNQFV